MENKEIQLQFFDPENVREIILDNIKNYVTGRDFDPSDFTIAMDFIKHLHNSRFIKLSFSEVQAINRVAGDRLKNTADLRICNCKTIGNALLANDLNYINNYGHDPLHDVAMVFATNGNTNTRLSFPLVETIEEIIKMEPKHTTAYGLIRYTNSDYTNSDQLGYFKSKKEAQDAMAKEILNSTGVDINSFDSFPISKRYYKDGGGYLTAFDKYHIIDIKSSHTAVNYMIYKD